MKKLGLAGVILALCAVALSAQDVIHLKVGGTLEGIIVGETQDTVTLQVPHGTFNIPRTQIKSLTRTADSRTAEDAQALLTLSRFEETETFHFLYREGYRVGYRTIAMRREVRDGKIGYGLHDRLVFVPRGGGSPDLDLQISEFADAELRPRGFQLKSSSGLSSRVVEGFREAEQLRIKETSGGRMTEQSTLFRKDAEFPGLLLKRLATYTFPEGGYPLYRVFRPETSAFSTLTLERRLDRIAIRGKLRDAIVFRATSGGIGLESWFDLAGNLIRQDIGSPRLISLSAPRDEVLAFARGEDSVEHDDLELEFISEQTGIRLLRPDNAWERVTATGHCGVVSFTHPGHRATIDVFRLGDLLQGTTEEGVALRVLSRLRAGSREFAHDGPRLETVAGLPALAFTATCRRRDVDIKTMGTIIVRGEQAVVVLAAAPTTSFGAAMPAFLGVLDSLRFLEGESARTSDPFERAQSQL